MKIEIDTEERIDIYAICLFGWGRGKTVGEALRNMRDASRGFVTDKFTAQYYDERRKRNVKGNVAECLDNQTIRLFATNETDGCAMEMYTLRPSKGKWALFLGDIHGNASFYQGKENEND